MWNKINHPRHVTIQDLGIYGVQYYASSIAAEFQNLLLTRAGTQYNMEPSLSKPTLNYYSDFMDKFKKLAFLMKVDFIKVPYQI